MQAPLMRIPYTGLLPPPNIIPRNSNTLPGAIAALSKFLTAPPSPSLRDGPGDPRSTVILSGAGISVASGLAGESNSRTRSYSTLCELSGAKEMYYIEWAPEIALGLFDSLFRVSSLSY